MVSCDVLTEALWPGRPPADPAMNLEVLVNRARDALGDDSLILAGQGAYSFAATERCTVDAETFLDRLGAGQDHLAAGSASAALQEFRLALDGWGGEPLAEDAHEEWAQEYRSKFGRARLETLEGAAAAALSLRDPGQALSLAELAVDREPLREAANLLLVRALADSGDTAAALAAYDRFRHRLADELGLDPSAEARELHARIQPGDRLTPHPRRPAGIGPRARFEELPFVGREDEIEAILEAVSGRDPGTVVVSGPVGVGKSRLLSEVAARTSVPVVAAKAFVPDREEAWGLARSLLRKSLALDVDAGRRIPERAAQALAPILPELEELRAFTTAALDPESRRALAMEGGVRLIDATTGKGALMVADNLQWADPTSLALLGQVAGRVRGLGLLLAYRPEELSRTAPLTSFLADLPNFTEVETIALNPLSEETVSDLVTDEGLARVLTGETDLTPLAISEVIRDLARQGAIEPDPGGGWRSRTEAAAELARALGRAGQRKAIQARAEQQPPGRRQILCLLSLLGRETSARLLGMATQADQGTVLDDLDSLARARLVRLGDEGWATAQDLIGEAIVEGLGRPERARLHHMLVGALADEGADPAELARHLEGMGERERAAEAFAEAARQRLERRAAAEAEHLAEAGLGLSSKPALRSALLETRAEGRAYQGDLGRAREDLRAALEARRSGPERSQVLARLAELTSGSEDYVRAGELIELALTEAGSDRAARAQALAVASILDINTDRLDRGQARADEALALFEQIGDAHGVARIMDVRALNTLFEGNLREAVGMCDRVARLFEDSGQLLRVREPRVSRGMALSWMGRAEEGLSDIEAALELERTLGRPDGEAYCLWARSEALCTLGRLDEARASAETAIDISRRIGHREWITLALTALGVACQMEGDLDAGEAAMRQAVEAAGDMPFISSVARMRLASILVDRGDLASAETYVTQAMRGAIPLLHLELGLIKARIALLRDDPEAEAIAVETLALAEAHGWVGSHTHAHVKQLVGTGAERERDALRTRRERKTFMFTDIVGSTNLVEALGDEAWEHLLRWHDQALRSLFARHQGTEIKQLGDGFFVAFDTPGAAIECAVAIHRALTEHRVEHGFSPRVRIGLHEAEATRKGDDYHGTGIHQAARIGALAQGGEILASQPIVAQPCRFSVSEPRPVRLKGYSDPITVVSIDWR
ncbi:MAG TPA: BTAD domain-containing putative transcriptional regulator [Actinomycetota bacterium]|nr:BTAD domain-containing putative transcriptional regulator [Actinomycetota bacterium]